MRPSELGRMDIKCSFCGAMHWIKEKTSGTIVNPVFESCCKGGKVDIPRLQSPPQLLRDLYTGVHEKSTHFLNNLRQYNSAFAFTSFGAKRTNINERRGGVNMLQVHGELYHLQGPIQNEPASATYAQLYIYDASYASAQRARNNSNNNLDAALIDELSTLLHNDCDNYYVGMYKHAHELLAEEDRRQELQNDVQPFHVRVSPALTMELIVGNDRRTENLPTVDEIAGIVPNETTSNNFRNIIITYRSVSPDNPSGCKRISETHAGYMPLHYVLLFPRGDNGWNWGLTLTLPLLPNGDRQANPPRLHQRAYYRYRIHQRLDEFSPLFYAKRLFQQYVIDVFGSCDQTALAWIREHQNSIRADVYNGLVDALNGDYNLNNVGTRSILPSSYAGGPRFMAKLYQDAMAIVRHLGKPSLFITFTANPRWVEIQNELLPGQSAIDRPDLVARVFNLKVRELLSDLKKGKQYRFLH